MSETDLGTPPSPASDPEGEPDRGRVSTDTETPSRAGRASRGEIVAALLGTVAADAFVFRAVGYSGLAAMFAIFPLLFWIGYGGRAGRALRRTGGCAAIGLVLLVSLRLLWEGSGWAVASGIAAVLGMSIAFAGFTPRVPEGLVLLLRLPLVGGSRMGRWQWRTVWGVDRDSASDDWARLATWGIPAVAVLLFGTIFVAANPDIATWFGSRFGQLVEHVYRWLEHVSAWEIPFCVVALLVLAGLLRPSRSWLRIGPDSDGRSGSRSPSERSPYFGACRNTLVVLIALFVVYLGFEFVTLWRREFPEGFYYAGYAHAGAAWLTVALALATVVLSAIFSGRMLRDPRLGALHRLAWIWSSLNLLLAVSVYNRLSIYVGYNGLTRMRIVGLFGITLVVVGFALVLTKILHRQSFWWLVRAQLFALVLAAIGYSLFPVDYIAHRYNVWRVCQGYLHPSVMIAVKPIDDEGYFPLFGLLDHEDRIIRDGVLAKLAKRQAEIERFSRESRWHWSRFRGSRRLLSRRLREHQSAWQSFREAPDETEAAITRFREYAMRWY